MMSSPSKVRLGEKRERGSPLNAERIISAVVRREPLNYTSWMKYKKLLGDIRELAVLCDEDDTKVLFCATEECHKFNTTRRWRENQSVIHDNMLDLKELYDRLDKKAQKHRRMAQKGLEAWKAYGSPASAPFPEEKKGGGQPLSDAEILEKAAKIIRRRGK